MPDNSVTHGATTVLSILLDWGMPKTKPKTLTAADALMDKFTKRYTMICAGVSWVPGSTFVLAGMDYRIYHDAAKIYRIADVNIDAVTAALATTVVGRVTAELSADVVLSFVPGVGWVIKAGVATAATKVLCEAVKAYMRERSPLS